MSTVREIAEAVAAETGVAVSDIMGPHYHRRAVRARWEIWKRLAALGWSSTQIGKPWRYDHTTVMHGLRMIGVKLRRCPPPMAGYGAAAERRRAETIRKYWAARGVDIKVNIDRAMLANGETIPAVRSSGIPVRGGV